MIHFTFVPACVAIIIVENTSVESGEGNARHKNNPFIQLVTNKRNALPNFSTVFATTSKQNASSALEKWSNIVAPLK